jgi:hypothetical protein
MNIEKFPRTTVGGVSLSRMIIGTNWLAGWGHRTASCDEMIKKTHHAPCSVIPMLEVFMEHGVDSIMAPFGQVGFILEAVNIVSEKLEKKMILIDTPVINVDDTAAARREARETIKQSRKNGAAFCLIHHTSCEQLVNKNKQIIERIGDYTEMIREEGMLPGLSAHMPEIITYCDNNEYDVETYIQLYNCLGFLMQIEVEAVHNIIHNAKKPVMTIKPMAAGRVTPFVGLNFSWATLRDCDMVTVGCFSAAEAREDCEISLAALERRRPNLEQRGSPNQQRALAGGKHD